MVIIIQLPQSKFLYFLYVLRQGGRAEMTHKGTIVKIWEYKAVKKHFHFLKSNVLIVGALTFQTSSKVTKRLHHIIMLFLGNDTKSHFLWSYFLTNNTQGVHEPSKILDTFTVFLSKVMNSKHVLVYGVLETANDLRSIFVGHIHFKKLTKFWKFIKIFLRNIFINKNHFNKRKYGTT